MTKTLLTLVATSIITLSCTAQAQKINTDNDKPVTKEHFAGKNFDGLKIGSKFDVEITKGDKRSIEITVPEFAVEHITVEINEGVAQIYCDNVINNAQNGFWSMIKRNNWEFNVKITTPDINNLRVSGQASVTFLSKFDAKNLTIVCSGQSSVENLKFDVSESVNLHTSGQSDIEDAKTTGAHNTTITCSGQSDIELSSQNTRSVTLATSGQSDISFDALTVENGKIHSSGQSDIDFNVTTGGEITASSSGSSSININGQLKGLSQKNSGSSSIQVN